MVIGVLWLILRFLTSFFAAVCSIFRPNSVIERTVAVWPVSFPLTTWLERVWLLPLNHWDTQWYVRILTNGYHAADGTAQFHPLLPALAAPFTWLGLSPLASLALVASLAGLAAFFMFFRLARLDVSPDDAQNSLFLFAFWPVSFVLFIPYTEGLFFLLAMASLYAARKQAWAWASILAALAVLTRQQGILLAIPIAVEIWEANQRDMWLVVRQKARQWLPLVFVPGAYLGWILYRNLALSDFSWQFQRPSDLIYKLLISPSAVEVVPYQIVFPWQFVQFMIKKITQTPDLDVWMNAIIGVFFLLLFILSWRGMRLSYRLYSLAIVLISFMFYTGAIHPAMGLVRHLWLAFPIFISLAGILNRPWQRLIYVFFGVMGALSLLSLYVFEAWVP